MRLYIRNPRLKELHSLQTFREFLKNKILFINLLLPRRHEEDHPLLAHLAADQTLTRRTDKFADSDREEEYGFRLQVAFLLSLFLLFALLDTDLVRHRLGDLECLESVVVRARG